jgi:hypothetical protein
MTSVSSGKVQYDEKAGNLGDFGDLPPADRSRAEPG